MAKDLQVTIRVRMEVNAVVLTGGGDPLNLMYCSQPGCDLTDGHVGQCQINVTNMKGTGNSKLVEDLRNVGIDLGPQHPCRADGKACGISVDYTADEAWTVITHRLGDKKDSREITDIMRSDVGWAKIVKEALAEMHNNQRGIGPVLNARPKLVTPYITQEESIDIATQIYEHTGGRVTVPHGRKTYGYRASTREYSIKEKNESEWQREERERGPPSEGEIEARNNMY